MRKINANLFFVFILLSICSLSGCQLFEDLLKEHQARTAREDFIGLWKNDSLETKVYENGILTEVRNQSLQGNTFEMRDNGTYTTAGPSGVLLNGTWELLSKGNMYQILLDKGKDIERVYDVKKITRNKLVTNRRVTIDNYRIEEYTFSYYK